MTVPAERIDLLVENAANPKGKYVLYWMTSCRRTRFNYALERAADWARELDRPLVVLEALRLGYRWASPRMHAFYLQGMADNRAALERAGAYSYAYLEPEAGAGRGLLRALSADACVVVTDDWPCFFIPHAIRAATAQLRDVGVRFEAIDANGLFPMRSTPAPFSAAVHLRRYLQRELAPHLAQMPAEAPLDRLPAQRATVAAATLRRWPNLDNAALSDIGELIGPLRFEHDVPPSPLAGGSEAGQRMLRLFLDEKLTRYGEDRSHPDDDVGSNLSPYLHAGHIGAHAIFRGVAEREDWDPSRIDTSHRSGAKEGYWGMSSSAEAFLDELVTWRELGFNLCVHRPDSYDRYASLPEWARQTLEKHRADKRDKLYELEELALSKTDDPLWNAAQAQLREEGRIHNALRMLWGKRVLTWTRDAQTALDVLVELNNRYALDGRDPNSYSGIFWTLGRYDRGWPERAIFGKVRTMTSGSAMKKWRVSEYLIRYGKPQGTLPLFAS